MKAEEKNNACFLRSTMTCISVFPPRTSFIVSESEFLAIRPDPRSIGLFIRFHRIRIGRPPSLVVGCCHCLSRCLFFVANIVCNQRLHCSSSITLTGDASHSLSGVVYFSRRRSSRKRPSTPSSTPPSVRGKLDCSPSIHIEPAPPPPPPSPLPCSVLAMVLVCFVVS